MKLFLSRMESLAMTGVVDRFQSALKSRNHDVSAVLAEHGVHYIPKSYVLSTDDDGYVRSIEWDNEQEDAPAPEGYHGQD